MAKRIKVKRTLKQIALDNFRQTLPEADRREQYVFLMTCWDVVRAKFLARDKEPVKIDVAAVAKSYGYPKTPQLSVAEQLEQTGHATISRFSFDQNKVTAGNLDMSRPLIFVELATDDGPNSRLLIDGHHRLVYAYQNGVEQLDAMLLNMEETEAIQS